MAQIWSCTSSKPSFLYASLVYLFTIYYLLQIDIENIGSTEPIRLGSERYGCPFCPSIKPSAAGARIHIRIHTGEKPFRCPYCPYASSHKSNLTTHMRLKHKPPTF